MTRKILDPIQYFGRLDSLATSWLGVLCIVERSIESAQSCVLHCSWSHQGLSQSENRIKSQQPMGSEETGLKPDWGQLLMLQGAESFVTDQTSPLHQHSLLKHDTMSQLTTQFVAGKYFIFIYVQMSLFSIQ